LAEWATVIVTIFGVGAAFRTLSYLRTQADTMRDTLLFAHPSKLVVRSVVVHGLGRSVEIPSKIDVAHHGRQYRFGQCGRYT
jgi:hypothetical protein